MSETNLTPAASAAPAVFDYSGLDASTVDTLHWAEKKIQESRRKYIADVAQAVAVVHDELVAQCDNSNDSNLNLDVQNLDGQLRKNQYSEETFINWCRFIGISKSTAYNLLQVDALLSGATPEEQDTLAAASPSLLYAAAKPSAPADLVQAVKDGDITTHKQYQELLKENQQLRADRVNALNRAQAAESQRDAAMADVNGLHEQNRQLAADNSRLGLQADKANARAKEAEKQLDGARQVAEAAKMRADKWQKEVEAAKAQPVEAVVDEEEIDRRAHKLAADLTAPLREELDALKARPAAGTTENDLHNAYDSLLLIGRSMQNAWKSVKPQLQKLPPDTRAGAINQLNNTLTEIQTEAMKCL